MKISKPRIALCLSGQARTWKRCHENWISTFYHLGSDVDIFCHFWDYNSLPRQSYTIPGKSAGMAFEDVPLSDEEKHEIEHVLRPKKLAFEKKLEIQEDFYKVKNKVSWWCIDQFSSMMKCAHLKRSYEIENRFQYDVVFRLRSDLFFTNQITLEPTILPNTLYSVHNSFDRYWNAYRISDIFFYADSHTYDQAAGFYRNLRYLDASYVTRDHKKVDFPPELAFYYYLKSVGIRIKQIMAIPLIKRTQEYLDIKGHLDAYETL